MNNELNANFDIAIPKYVLNPGYVFSKSDGDEHFITARRLAELYRVPMSACVIRPDVGDPRNRGWYSPPGAIELYPRFDGNYMLPPNVKVTGAARLYRAASVWTARL